MATIRQEIISLLSDEEYGAGEISREMSIQEKEVYNHLSHISRSVKSQKRELVIAPSQCILCGYSFETRKRFTRPSRCPRCKSERIKEPRYRIVCKDVKRESG